MIQFDLNGTWTMHCPDGRTIDGTVPGSVYSFLLQAGEMDDPFYRDNELKALRLMEQDYSFSRSFSCGKKIAETANQILRFDGIDTLADIWLNETFLGSADNMHRFWEFPVNGILKEGENHLKVCLHSPTAFIKEEDEKYHLGGSDECMRGFPHLRKAHCMFGWDWGPRLPDQGIWKDVSLLGYNESRLTDVRITQSFQLPDGTDAFGHADHCKAAREGLLTASVTVTASQTGCLPVRITLTDPDGNDVAPDGALEGCGEAVFCIPKPSLWWPNGLGDQPLYTVTVSIGEPGTASYQEISKRIGLRTVTMRRSKDSWGESFATEVNGQTFFAMGADYIPEDNILSRITRETTRDLLETCIESHFNVIRVWGGGYYPCDDFYDLCDEMGLLVWQDMMFACANYRITDAFVENITEEIRQNVRRIRHHASLGLWCGNNEMEQFAAVGVYDGDDITKADYLIQNEYIIPQILKEEDPGTFYWPSSPSSGGKYVTPSDPNHGDIHYWEVWHGGVPFTAYRAYCFRYLSEFGFQSFPCIETIASFTEPEDRNIFSYVMEMHQRNSGANGKIMQYLSMTYRYPGDFETLIYASQLLQADAIRYGVEHFRRNRNDDRCMGAVYWQLNDIWPVASWASIDYFHRWKALQYYAKRFFAPVMLSCEEESISSQGRTCISEPAKVPFSAKLCVTNETWEEASCTVLWEFRDPESRILREGSCSVTVPSFSSVWLDQMDLSDIDPYTQHLAYRLEGNESSCGSVLFAPPKHYRFADPGLTVQYDPAEGTVTVTAKAFARSVEVYSSKGCIRLDDNFFDLEAGSRTLRLIKGDPEGLLVRSVYDIR